MKEPAQWPEALVYLADDGTGSVNIGGTVTQIVGANIEEAREQVASVVAGTAQRLHRPIRMHSTDPSGTWVLVVDEEGQMEPDSSNTVPRIATPAEPAAQTDDSSDDEAPENNSEDLDRDTDSSTVTAGPDEEAPVPVQPRRASFLGDGAAPVMPATAGWRGWLNGVGFKLEPGPKEKALREDEAVVRQHWSGPRTISVVNGKGGAGKTPTTALLAAVFAREGGAGVLAWDNNQTRGTLGWRTEQGPHENTILELLPEADRLLGTGAQSADLAYFTHHQSGDRFDVLRSQPIRVASDQRIAAEDVDRIHAVASKFYRMIVMDSGNDESDPMWLRMIDHTDQLVVVTTTRDDHAEAGALLVEQLQRGTQRNRRLAANAVVIVTQADPYATKDQITRVADGYRELGIQDVVTIPHDRAMVRDILRFERLQPETQRAWVAAAAAVARKL